MEFFLHFLNEAKLFLSNEDMCFPADTVKVQSVLVLSIGCDIIDVGLWHWGV